MRRAFGGLPLLVLWALPVLASIAAFIVAAVDGRAWSAMFQHPQLWPALGLSLFTGISATAAALICTLMISAGFYRSPAWHRLQPLAAAGLALPHLAFAIGFGFLIMPSGLLARLIVGGEQPPHWVTTQDPLGLSLIVVLALKEIPFLLAMTWGVLATGDAAASLEGQCRAAASLGHGQGSAWLRIVQPQLLRRLAWPLVIVFIYSASVVDLALVIGPTQPPTLAVVSWHDLNDADAATNARGLAASLLLAVMLSIALCLAAMLIAAARVAARDFLSAGPSPLRQPRALASGFAVAGGSITFAVGGLLVLLSVSSRWPYPSLLPPSFTFAAWTGVIRSSDALWLSVGIGAAAAITALALVVLWFETQGAARDRWLIGLSLVSLTLPQLVIVAGQYRAFLPAGLTGNLGGVFLSHLTPVLAYVAITLSGPYRAFDGRYAQVARSLEASSLAIWWKIKLPLLKAPILTAAAVGFGVSMVQYVPTQLIAAGRYQTLPTEAVTLSSGGNRALIAAFAVALAVPPLLAFALAGIAGRPRWH